MNVLLLKYERNKIGLALLLSVFLLSFNSFGQIIEANTDSVGRSLLFRSHLLLTPDQFSPETLDSLNRIQVPVAVKFADDQDVVSLKQTIDQMHFHYIFISDQNSNLLGTNIKTRLLEKYGSAGKSTYLWVESLPDSLWNLRSLLEIWEQKGRIPVFVSAPKGKEMRSARLVMQLNRQQKIFGIVRNDDKLLPDVLWKGFPDRKTNGYFSFPVNEEKSLPFAPYKPGYRFSPDIILPSPENISNLKVFNALPLDHDFGLTDEFLFPGKVKNSVRNNNDEVTLYGVKFDRDTQKGDCAWFSGRAYLDGGLKSRVALKPNFTITAWIKPTELGNNNCILGKGKDFVLKIHHGQLTFTVQGVKDYISAKTRIQANQWSCIGLVHSNAENLIRFYLNGQLTDEVKLLVPYTDSDYTVLIGSNLWEEFFKGYISEIKIWERELNDDELKLEFSSMTSGSKGVNYLWISAFALVAFFAAGLGISFLRKKRKVIPVATNELVKPKVPEVTSLVQGKEYISCFGGLKVVGSDGIEVSRKLSPKLRQLFVLILLHSIGEKKGISSKEMSEVLWPGMSPQNTKNIRGTNIQNLKALLAPCLGLKLVFQDKLWFFEFSNDYFIDYAFVENWLNEERYYDLEKLTNRLPYFLSILKKGPLFQSIDESWLDPYVSQMSARIVEYGESLFQVLLEGRDDGLLLEVAEIIGVSDPLNELALRKRVTILTRQGKLGLAHVLYDNFVKLYFELYQEKYRCDFKTLLSGE